MPPNTVYVGRPTKWGNPWTPENHYVICLRGQKVSSRHGTIVECIDVYEQDIMTGNFGKYFVKEVQQELAGKNLACWCPLDQPCHADVLLKLANPTS